MTITKLNTLFESKLGTLLIYFFLPFLRVAGFLAGFFASFFGLVIFVGVGEGVAGESIVISLSSLAFVGCYSALETIFAIGWPAAGRQKRHFTLRAALATRSLIHALFFRARSF